MTLPFLRIGWYEIKPELPLYSLPQSSKQTKRQWTPTPLYSNPLSAVTPMRKLRRKWLLTTAVNSFAKMVLLLNVLPSCFHAISVSCKMCIKVLSTCSAEGMGNHFVMGNPVTERNNNSSNDMKIPIPIQTLTTMPTSSHRRHRC